ncbi:hypothetical protein DWUX_2429 [Desulfovibrio diazotrophicus]|nr:hypothetical protein DWUX_2429 [Desulfovibrio diazotrophicus]
MCPRGWGKRSPAFSGGRYKKRAAGGFACGPFELPNFSYGVSEAPDHRLP